MQSEPQKNAGSPQCRHVVYIFTFSKSEGENPVGKKNKTKAPVRMADELMGMQGEDRITGFRGVVTGHCCYISGCSQVLLAPRVVEGQAPGDAKWFDEQRVLVFPDAAIVKLDNGLTPGHDAPAPVR